MRVWGGGERESWLLDMRTRAKKYFLGKHVAGRVVSLLRKSKVNERNGTWCFRWILSYADAALKYSDKIMPTKWKEIHFGCSFFRGNVEWKKRKNKSWYLGSVEFHKTLQQFQWRPSAHTLHSNGQFGMRNFAGGTTRFIEFRRHFCISSESFSLNERSSSEHSKKSSLPIFLHNSLLRSFSSSKLFFFYTPPPQMRRFFSSSPFSQNDLYKRRKEKNAERFYSHWKCKLYAIFAFKYCIFPIRLFSSIFR